MRRDALNSVFYERSRIFGKSPYRSAYGHPFGNYVKIVASANASYGYQGRLGRLGIPASYRIYLGYDMGSHGYSIDGFLR